MLAITVKFVGLFCVFVACTMIGLQWGGRDRRRSDALENFKAAAKLLKSDIRFRHTALPYALMEAGARVKPLEAFLNNVADELTEANLSFADAWTKHVRADLKSFELTDDDRESIRGLAATLGHLDIEAQNISLDTLIEYIDEKQKELAPQILKNQKLYRSLGVLTGLMLVVILL